MICLGLVLDKTAVGCKEEFRGCGNGFLFVGRGTAMLRH
jgi:hypothetical protein